MYPPRILGTTIGSGLGSEWDETVQVDHARPDADVFGLGLTLYDVKHESGMSDVLFGEKRCAVVVPLPTVTRFILHKYGINLVALGSFEAAGHRGLYFPSKHGVTQKKPSPTLG